MAANVRHDNRVHIKQLREQFSDIERAWMRMHDGVCMLGLEQEYHEAFRGLMKLHWAIQRERMRYNREMRAEAKQRANAQTAL